MIIYCSQQPPNDLYSPPRVVKLAFDYEYNILDKFILSVSIIISHAYLFFADIPECDSNPCHEHAKCTELAPGFECTCKLGYVGNGFACEGMTMTTMSRTNYQLWM